MSTIENKPEVESIDKENRKEFLFVEDKVSTPSKDGTVTVKLTKDSAFINQCHDKDEATRVLKEVGEYQSQMATWSQKRAVELMEKDKEVHKVKVKSAYGTKTERTLGIDVVAVRERQMGPTHRGPYIATEIKSDLLIRKDKMKELREQMAKSL